MRKIAFGLLVLVSSVLQAHAQDEYIICHNSDRRGPWREPVVSTLVISPEIEGKRYFTSWVGGKAGRGFSGIGPLEVSEFEISEEKLSVVFPIIDEVMVHHYLSLEATKTDEPFYVFRSLGEDQVRISYLDRNIFGRQVSRTTGSSAQVQCYIKINDESSYIDPSINFVTVDEFGVQHYHFRDRTYASQISRSLQESLLIDFVQKL